MALVVFKKGLLSALPEDKTEGTFYVVTDERAIYLDISGTDRIRIGDFQEVESDTALEDVTSPNSTTLYYLKDAKCFAKYNGESWDKIGLDTGAVKVEVSGDGNAVDTATYEEDTRTIKLTMTKTFVEESALSEKVNAAVTEMGFDTKYAPSDHDHTVEDVTDLQTALDAKAATETVTGIDTRVKAIEEKIGDITGAMHFKGVVEEDPTSMAELDSYKSGDVVSYTSKEYVFDGEKFVELGDETKEAQDISKLQGQVSALEAAKHTHANTEALDKISDDKITAWDNAVTAQTWGTF